MDIKLKNNKNNSDMNYSENDVNAMKKKVYKSKGIIATLVSLLIIASAALGMCKAYPIIDKSARNIENNYFEHYGFAEDLAETSYVNYFSTLSEKNEGNLSPGKTLLNLESNIYSNENYYTGEEWGNAEYYDICIDVSKVGEDGALRLIEAYINETGVL